MRGIFTEFVLPVQVVTASWINGAETPTKCKGQTSLQQELEKEGQESKILLPCWAVLTSLSVFLSGLWALPLLLFSAKNWLEK